MYMEVWTCRKCSLTLHRPNLGMSAVIYSSRCLKSLLRLTIRLVNTGLPAELIHSVSVSPECISAFNDLKLGKSTKWIIYKISDDWKEIVVEETSTSADYSAFREKLLNAKSKDRRGKEGMGGRYAVYDLEYENEGEGKRYVSYQHVWL